MKMYAEKESMLRKKVVFAMVLLVSHAIFFVGGAFTGKQVTTSWFVGATQVADAQIALGHYATYRDIALDINAGQIRKAKCNANLGASAMFDGVKDCLLEESCKARLQPFVLQSAPEISGSAPIAFEYIATKDGRKNCEGAKAAGSD